MIDSFTGDYAFLSNFWAEPVTLKGITFRTAEHAYQACKNPDPQYRGEIIAAGSPAAAKALGRRAPLRPDWEQVKVNVMRAVIAAKFAPTTELSHRLMLTGNEHLVEGNTWGDKFWGCVREPHENGTWVGRNELGIILMAQRETLRHEIPYGPVVA